MASARGARWSCGTRSRTRRSGGRADLHALDPIHLANGLTGFAFLGLGAWVLRVRARDPRNLAFGVFALTWAVNVFVSNFWLEVGHAPAWAVAARVVLPPLLSAALLGLTLVHPTRVTRREGGRVALAAVLGIGAYALTTASGSFAFEPPAYSRTGAVSVGIFYASSLAALCILALRWLAADGDGRRGIELTFSALGIWYAYGAGDGAGFAETTLPAAGSLVFPLLAAALWLRNASHDDARRARLVAWAVLGAALVAMLERAAFPAAPDLWGYGVARLAGVAILAYAIVRHQLLGIDVKVRWTISRSTTAAAFVAVFFLASEGAQLLFGQGNELVGLVAAGGLVFALAPLQRAAELLAERAVPVATTPAANRAATRREETYRAALRMAWSDGRVSDEDEDALDRLADDLGLPRTTTTALRREAETERGGGARA